MTKRVGRSDPRYGSRRWKWLRLDIRRRDLYECQRCGSDQRLQVDHIVSPNPALGGGDFWDPANLRLLCARCNNARNNPAFREDAPPQRNPLQAPYRRPSLAAPDASASGARHFAYHRHLFRLGREMHVGFMTPGRPLLDTCPPDCTLPRERNS